MITTPPSQLDLQSADETLSSSSSPACSSHNRMLESRLGDECNSPVSASASTSTAAQQNLASKQESATSMTTTPLSSSRQKIVTTTTTPLMPKLIEKSVIIHKDENGFGLRIKGQAPVYIEHVHEGGAAWRAGVRALDSICKVNGIPVKQLDHKDVVLMFKSCSRFVALTLVSQEHLVGGYSNINSDQTASMISDLLPSSHYHHRHHHQKQYSIYDHQPDRDRRWLVSACGSAGTTTPEGAPLFGPTNDSLSLLDANSCVSQLTSSLLFVDRTKSFKSTLNASSQSVASDQIRHLALKQLQHQRLDRVTSTSQLDSSTTRGGSKLNRRDSGEDTTTGERPTSGDKRLAICTSCRQEQRQFETIGTGGESVGVTATCSQCKLELAGRQAGHEGQFAQRQLHMSLRDARMDSKLVGQQHRQHLYHQLESAASDQNLATKDKSSRARGGAKAAAAAAAPLVSIAAASQPLVRGDRSPPGVTANELQPQPAKPKVVVNKRIEIIREFIDTERTHTERLRCLDELFYRPLKQANFMNGEQLRMVFSCHRTLYKIHRQIYRILLSANYDFYSEPLIGSALLEIFEGDLKRRLERASCSFCSAQATNIELLNKFTRRDTKVGEFLAQVTSKRMIGRLGIKDLLASCFQRLTKYPLLLENLLKATPQTVSSDDDDDLDHAGGPDSADSKRASQINRLRLLSSPRSARSRRVVGGGSGSSGGQRSVSDDECGGGGGGESDYDDRDGDGDGDGDGDDEDDNSGKGHLGDQLMAARRARLDAAEEARRNTRRMLAISLAEEREFIERALYQSRQILFKVNEAIRVAVSRLRLKEIWKRTDKYPGVPLIDITKQQVIHEGLLTLRLSKRSFDVYVLLLNDYIIILTREGQDKYRLKFFTPEGKSASASASSSAAAALSLSVGIGNSSSGLGGASGGTGPGGSGTPTSATNSATNTALTNLTTPHQTVYSPVFVIDEHLTTRDAATDENGFYLLCKRKDDSRIYEFASRSPVERMKWRDKIQWAIERQMSRQHSTSASSRRPSCGSILTKSSSDISASCGGDADNQTAAAAAAATTPSSADLGDKSAAATSSSSQQRSSTAPGGGGGEGEPTKIVGTISYVIDDGIVMPSKMESSRVFVDQAIQVNILDGTTLKAGNSDESAASAAGLKAAS